MRARLPVSRDPLSSVSTAARSSSRARIPSASRFRIGARPSAPSAAQAGNARRAASTAASTSALPPRAICAIVRPSIGERTSKRSLDATRRPPIQWSVRTSAPAISVVFLLMGLPRSARLGSERSNRRAGHDSDRMGRNAPRPHEILHVDYPIGFPLHNKTGHRLLGAAADLAGSRRAVSRRLQRASDHRRSAARGARIKRRNRRGREHRARTGCRRAAPTRRDRRHRR